MQDCSNSSANALELLQSCTKPSNHNTVLVEFHFDIGCCPYPGTHTLPRGPLLHSGHPTDMLWVLSTAPASRPRRGQVTKCLHHIYGAGRPTHHIPAVRHSLWVNFIRKITGRLSNSTCPHLQPGPYFSLPYGVGHIIHNGHFKVPYLCRTAPTISHRDLAAETQHQACKTMENVSL